MRIRNPWTIAAVAVVTVALASCTNSSGSDDDAAPSDAAANSSTQGVTDDSIRVGIVAADNEGMPEGIPIPDLGDVIGQAESFADAINESGGINGRQIELFTYEWNALADPLTDQRAKCLEATEDDGVFVVLASAMFGDPVLCVTQQHETPMILAGGPPQSLVDESGGLLYVSNFTAEHAIEAAVGPIVDTGELEGRTLAVILEESADSQAAVDTGLIAPLEARGYTISDQVRIGLNAEGMAALTASVQRLKSAGVDGIFLTVNQVFDGLFMQAAEQADYHPQYYLTDLAEGASTFVANTAPAAQLEGAIGVTWHRTGSAAAGEEPSPFDEDCIDTYATASGQAPPEQDSEIYQSVATTCSLFSIFEEAATAAGADLTVGALVDALQGMDSFPLGFGADGSFGPDKFDAPDAVRLLRFDGACACWVADGPFEPVAF